jgi:hypothetical protein
MGKSESATASIGIKILLSDLVMQINETNLSVIKKMLEDGFIEDENDFFNEVFESIIWNENFIGNTNFVDVKRYLISELQNKGSIMKYKFSPREEPTLSNGCLFDKTLLVPVKKILETCRWGYDRYGTNGRSIPMNFDLSVDLEKYKDIEKFETVFILLQQSG